MSHSVRWSPVALLLLAGGATAGPRSAVVTDSAIELPIRDVTVFSDRARVTRAADVHLDKGQQTLTFPLLPATVDPASIRVESTNARVTRVEVMTASLNEFPKNEAEKLLEHIDALRDELTAIAARIEVLHREEQILSGIRPNATPRVDDHSPPALLDPSGWHVSLQFIDARQAAIAADLAPLEAQQKQKQEELTVAVEKGQQMAALQSATDQLKVSAVVEGNGKVTELSLIYIAVNAVWRPGYDVRFTPGDPSVDVGFAAYVAQQTGEDWSDAHLTFSTAIPTTVTSLPQLAVWKIGERERFIPTPEPLWEQRTTPAADSGEETVTEGAPPSLDETLTLRAQLAQEVAANDETKALDFDGDVGGAGLARGAFQTKEEKSRRYDRKGHPKYKRPMGAPAAAPTVMALPPPPAPPPADMPMPAAAEPMMEVSSQGAAYSAKAARPTESVSFGAPGGWTAPVFAGDLPASLAGGYTFTYPSARAESIRSGGELRRVPLFSRRFPATPFLKIQPALSKQAFLVAEVSNDGDRPLLGGQAHLFVGADLVGDANVPTTAVGQKVTLPLGIDDAVRIERNVTTVESQQGVFTKQDVNSYQVVIELLNPRAKLVKARVVDQIPLSEQKDVTITFDKRDPLVVPDKTDGTLQWELDLPPGAKKTLSFTYSLARPRNARMQQHSAPTAGEH